MKFLAGVVLLAATTTATLFDTFYLKTTAVGDQPELFVVAESDDLHESNLVLKQQPANAALFAFKNETIGSLMAHGSRHLTLSSCSGSQVGRVVIGDRPATTGLEKDDCRIHQVRMSFVKPQMICLSFSERIVALFWLKIAHESFQLFDTPFSEWSRIR